MNISNRKGGHILIMRCYTLDSQLKRHNIDIPKTSDLKTICLYLKKNHGIGSYYIEGNKDITIVIDKSEIRYFTSLCN